MSRFQAPAQASKLVPTLVKLAWATDIHLNIAGHRAVETFLSSVRDADAEAVLVAGDIAEAPSIGRWLAALRACGKPLYFVLGNHDYYHGSIAEVRGRMLSEPGWLPNANVVELTTASCLIGHGGWADGRLGDYAGSNVMLNDFFLIEELAHLSRDERLVVLQRLGDEAAAHVRRVLSDALARYRHVVFLTHVPPFRAACWHEGQTSADDWLPHFTCKAIGDALTDLMGRHPDKQLTVLCGHSHGGGTVEVLPNLEVVTGGATYGAPQLQELLELA